MILANMGVEAAETNNLPIFQSKQLVNDRSMCCCFLVRLNAEVCFRGMFYNARMTPVGDFLGGSCQHTCQADEQLVCFNPSGLDYDLAPQPLESVQRSIFGRPIILSHVLHTKMDPAPQKRQSFLPSTILHKMHQVQAGAANLLGSFPIFQDSNGTMCLTRSPGCSTRLSMHPTAVRE